MDATFWNDRCASDAYTRASATRAAARWCRSLLAAKGDRSISAVKVLVIEDEKKISSLVRKWLEAVGFVVETTQNGDEGYLLATTRSYDVLILDIMLPGRDGLSILRNLRERKIALPVILLTARSELNERLEGLNLGADDYLTKPFFIEELVARIHAVTRRASGAVQSILSVSDLSMNLLTREVQRRTTKIELTPREFTLLEHLMRSPGRVLTRVPIDAVSEQPAAAWPGGAALRR
jgi:two-component system, OmpR family, response regulator